MRNQPGISWGYNNPINLVRHPKGWAAFFCFDDNTREIIKIFKPKDHSEYYAMLKQVSLWSYNTDRLCSEVRVELSWTS